MFGVIILPIKKAAQVDGCVCVRLPSREGSPVLLDCPRAQGGKNDKEPATWTRSVRCSQLCHYHNTTKKREKCSKV